jgi:predicted murein hydrolase (TIGR00659 family)
MSLSNAWQQLVNSPLLGLGITLLAFKIGTFIYLKSSRSPLFQPVFVGLVLVIVSLYLFDISFEKYYSGATLLNLLLGPCVVALAVPLYLNISAIKQHAVPLVVTLIIGSIVAVGSAVLIAYYANASQVVLLSLWPKSITSAIAMIVSENIGGIAALTASIVMITGVLGAIIGPSLMNMMGIKDPVVRGVTLGINAHAVGTVTALEESQKTGAFAALAMSLMGILHAMLIPLLLA